MRVDNGQQCAPELADIGETLGSQADRLRKLLRTNLFQKECPLFHSRSQSRRVRELNSVGRDEPDCSVKLGGHSIYCSNQCRRFFWRGWFSKVFGKLGPS